MKYIYRIYQLFIAMPLIAIYTVVTCFIVIVGCAIGNGHFGVISQANGGLNLLCAC